MTTPISHDEMVRKVNIVMAGDRLFANTEDMPNGCVEWRGCINSRGYGVISVAGCRELTHRISYELHVGPVPDGLQIDHLCRNKLCVHPDHLEAVTAEVNNHRKPNVHKTHCKHGHEMTEANTIVKRRKNGTEQRNCRACNNAQQRAARLRKDAA